MGAVTPARNATADSVRRVALAIRIRFVANLYINGRCSGPGIPAEIAGRSSLTSCSTVVIDRYRPAASSRCYIYNMPFLD